MVGGALGDELAGPEIVEVDGVALVFQPEGKQEVPEYGEMNQPVFVQGPERFHPRDKYPWIVAALSIGWLAELA